MSYESNKSAILRYLDEKDKKRPPIKNNTSAEVTSNNRTASPSPLPTINANSTSQNRDLRSRTVEMNRRRADSDSNYSPAGVDRKSYDALRRGEYNSAWTGALPYLPKSHKNEESALRASMKESSDKINAAQAPEAVRPEYSAEQRKTDIDTYTKKYKEAEAKLNQLKTKKRSRETYENVKNAPDFAQQSAIGAKSASNKVENSIRGMKVSEKLLPGGVPDQAYTHNHDARYLTMTDDERAIYNYYVGSGYNDYAEEYLSALDGELAERLGQSLADKVDAEKYPIVKYAKKANTAVGAGFDRFFTGLGDAWNRYVALDDSVPSPSPIQLQHSANMERADGFTRATGDVLYTVGNMVPSVAASAIPVVGKGLGVASMGISSAGGSYADARREGKDDESAAKYGLMEGGKEALMQYLLGGIKVLGGKVAVSKVAGKAAGKLTAVQSMKNAVKTAASMLNRNPSVQAALKTAARFGADAADEAVEEYLQEIIEPAIRNIAFDENNEVKPFTAEALYAAALGGITAGIFNVPYALSHFKNAKAAQENLNGKIKKEPYQFPVNGLQLSETDAAKDPVHIPQPEENVNKNFVPLPILDKNGNTKADFEANKAYANTTPITLPIKAGKATTIYNPYIGDVPVKVREQASKRIAVPENALLNAISEIAKAKQSSEGGSIKNQLRKVYSALFKSMGGQKSVVIENLGFNKKPYAVSINTKSIDKIVSDKHLSAEKLALIECLDEIIANATYVGSSAFDRIHKKAKDTIRFDYFETPVKINNENFIVSFDVEVFTSANNYKTHKVINEMDLVLTNSADVDPVSTAPEGHPGPKNPTSTNSADTNPVFAAPESYTGSNNSITHSNGDVNRNSKKFSEQKESIGSTTCGVNEKFVPLPILDKNGNAKADGEGKKARTAQGTPKRMRNHELWRKVLDEGYSVYDAGKVLNNKNLYAFYNNARQAQAAGQFMVTNGQTDINGKKVGKSLDEIFDPIKKRGSKYADEFDRFLLCRHAIDREKAGKPLRVDDGKGGYVKNPSEEVRELMLKHPEFETRAEEVYDFNRNLLRYRVASELISQKTADMLNEKYPHYVPTHRDSDTSYYELDPFRRDSIPIGTGIHSLRGGDGKVLPIYEQMSKMTMQTVSQAKKNIFANRLEKAVLEDPLKSSYYASTPNTVEKLQSLDDFNGNFITDGMLLYHKNGVASTMDLSPEMAEAFKALTGNGRKLSGLEKGFRKINNAYKSLITEYNPIFTVKNFTRDIADALFMSKNTGAFLKELPNAVREMRIGGELWQQFEALGGTASSIYNYDGTDSVFKKSGTIKRNTIDKISEANRFVEMIPRFAEFCATVKNGDGSYECLMEAMHNAADITVNFQRGGTAVKQINSTFVPYLNAGIQGLDKNVRMFTDTHGAKQWAALIFKAALFGLAPTLLNEFLLGDDEDYKNLRASDKRENYIIKCGENQFIKIPSGRLTKSLGNIASEGAKALRGEDTDFVGLISNLVAQLAPTNPLTNNIFSPILNVSSNRTWWGGEIEDAHMKTLPVAERYDSYTSEIGKWAGRTFGVSPKKVDYLIDAYTGIAGDVVLPLSTNPDAEGTDIADKLSAPFKKDFYIDGRVSNEISAKFYDKADEIRQKANSRYAVASDKLVLKYINKQSQKASEQYAKLRTAVGDSTLSYADKQSQKLELYKLIGDIQKNALSNVDAFGNAAKKYSVMNEKYAYFLSARDVFGLDYAINTLTGEAERKKMKALTSVGIDAQEVFELTDALKKFDEDNDSRSRSHSGAKSKKQKSIEHIKNLELDDKQRAAVYGAYLFNDTDQKYSYLAKKIGLSEDVIGNIYGDLSVMEGEKNSSGKTISGSQNKNVYKYVNKLDLPSEQKRLLFAWFANSTNEQKKQRKSVINELDIAQGDRDTVLRWLTGDKTISDAHIEKIFCRAEKIR